MTENKSVYINYIDYLIKYKPLTGDWCRKLCYLFDRHSTLAVYNLLLVYQQVLKLVQTFGNRLLGCTSHISSIGIIRLLFRSPYQTHAISVFGFDLLTRADDGNLNERRSFTESKVIINGNSLILQLSSGVIIVWIKMLNIQLQH